MEKQTTIEEDRHYGLSEVDIMYFLSHLRNGNLDCLEYRKLLINVMVNSVYIYSDKNKATIIFNVSNQPPVKADISLLDEILASDGSYTSRLSPPQYVR